MSPTGATGGEAWSQWSWSLEFSFIQTTTEEEDGLYWAAQEWFAREVLKVLAEAAGLPQTAGAGLKEASEPVEAWRASE